MGKKRCVWFFLTNCRQDRRHLSISWAVATPTPSLRTMIVLTCSGLLSDGEAKWAMLSGILHVEWRFPCLMRQRPRTWAVLLGRDPDGCQCQQASSCDAAQTFLMSRCSW